MATDIVNTMQHYGAPKSTKQLRSSRFLTAVLLGLATLLLIQRTPVMVFKHVVSILIAPIVSVLELFQWLQKAWRHSRLHSSGQTIRVEIVEEQRFPDVNFFERVITKLEGSGLRSTASTAHEHFMLWIRQELAKIPDIAVKIDKYDILRWQPANSRTLKQAGSLRLELDDNTIDIDIAGAVPYSKPSPHCSGELVHIDPKHSLSSVTIEGKIVIREIPNKSLPVLIGRIPSYSTTPDLRFDCFGSYNRPSFWEIAIHQDLVDAGNSGAVGVVFIIDLPRAQLDSYWDPHQGTHYNIPAVFCASEDIPTLQRATSQRVNATIAVHAEVSMATTYNIFATLPGQKEEAIVYSTHTDGNTCVQDNGVAALLALAQYFSELPMSERQRTLQFAFNTAHLHVSKEGSGRHAQQLDTTYDKDRTTALIIPVEHLGTRELEARPNPTGEGRILRYTGRGELMIWCVGPSNPLVRVVEEAVQRRHLDRVMITRGLGIPRLFKVPTYTSFGGLGTLYHNALLPTTSLISGPWSLFAPSFGAAAVDVKRMRDQTLALGDLYLAVENLTREEIAGGYLKYRAKRRTAGTKVYDGFIYPPEVLDTTDSNN